MICPSCGNQIADNLNFCPVCGGKTSGQPAQPQYTAPQQPVQQPQQPHYNQQYSQPQQPVQPQYNQPYGQQQYGQPQYGQPYYAQPYAQPTPPPAKKKNKAVIIIAIVVAALVAMGVIGAIAENAFMTTDQKIEAWIDDSGREDSTYFDESTYKMEIYARNDSLVYSYQYKTALMDEKATAQVLQKSLDNYSSTYKNVYRILKEDVPDAKSVIVEYLNKDGKVIASKEFK